MMTIDKLLAKLEPLMPHKVRQWRRTLDLSDPDLRALLEKEIFATAYKKLGDFRNRPLLSLPSKEKAKGALHLGTILYEEPKWSVGLSLSELMQNLGIFGRSGAGKTNVAFHIMEQLSTKRIPFLFLDWKRTARHLLPRFRHHVQLFTPGRKVSPFPFNPFIPPPGLEPSVYANHIVDVLGDAYTLGDAARSVLHKAVSACYDQGLFAPTLGDIVQRVEATPDKERVRGWKVSALRALYTLSAVDLGRDKASQETMVDAIARKSTIVELDGLSPSNKKFLIPLLCLWIYYRSLPLRNREKLHLVIFVEEAHHVLYHRGAYRESLMEMLMRQCRELGIGMIAIDQCPHLISSAAIGNMYTSICMNLKDPRDVNKGAALSLMENGDKKHLAMLPVGQGVLKLQDRLRQPILVQFPLVEVSKGLVTDEAVEAYSRRDHTVSAFSGPKSSRGRDWEGKRGAREGDAGLGDGELRFVEDIIAHADDGVDVRYKRLGMSVDKGNKIKNRLVVQGVLEEQLVRVGKTRRLLLRVTPRAKHELGLTTQHLDRGSLVHEYWKRWYARKFEAEGFHVQMEAPRNRGYVDVLARRGAESVAIEVETGASRIIWNIEQDLLSNFTRILVVATNQTAKQKLEQQLAKAGLIMNRITVLLRDGGDQNNGFSASILPKEL